MFYEEVKNGHVQLYDFHGECNRAEGCQFRRNKNEFSGCSGIMGNPNNHYCSYKPNYPHIELNYVFVKCGE